MLRELLPELYQWSRTESVTGIESVHYICSSEVKLSRYLTQYQAWGNYNCIVINYISVTIPFLIKFQLLYNYLKTVINWLRHSNRDIADVSQSFSMERSHTSVVPCVPTVPSTVNYRNYNYKLQLPHFLLSISYHFKRHLPIMNMHIFLFFQNYLRNVDPTAILG